MTAYNFLHECISLICELELKANINDMNGCSITIEVGVVVNDKTHLDTHTVLMTTKSFKDGIDVVSTHRSVIQKWHMDCHQVRNRLSIWESTSDAPIRRWVHVFWMLVNVYFAGFFDISEVEVNHNEVPKLKNLTGSINSVSSSKFPCSFKNDNCRTNVKHNHEYHMDGFGGYSRTSRTGKRKRTFNIMTSDHDQDIGSYANKKIFQYLDHHRWWWYWKFFSFYHF